MIRKSKISRFFAGIKSFPLAYEANREACMTFNIFESWFKNLNKNMKIEKRKLCVS